MPTNIVVPPLGESVTQATLLRWLKKEGEPIAKDEPVVEMETDKANVDIPSPAAGVLRYGKKPGDAAQVGETIGRVDESGAAAGNGAATSAAPASQKAPAKQAESTTKATVAASAGTTATALDDLSPAVRRIVEENKVDVSKVRGTGPGDRITKEDVQGYVDGNKAAAEAPKPTAEPTPPPVEHKVPTPSTQASAPLPAASSTQVPGAGQFNANGEHRAPMSKMRKRIAENLVRAQQTAAILTTFNEVDLKAIQDLRAKYKDRFAEVHGVGLGLMSFFARAVALALKEFPRVNAFIDGDDVVYHNYVHLGIAVSTERGLAVPVLRNAESMSFAKIESEIKRLAAGVRDGKLSIPELSGGTFTITNGGVFGSLLSTPILNPPQSGILGMHTIQKRPIVVDDKIEIRPMMYVALSYDHRIVDGRESVSFLVRMKQYLEDPARLILEI